MTDFAASGPGAEQTRAAVAALWERNLPVVRARLDLLDQAASTVPLPAKLRLDAMAVAHKLAGSLGMFGFAEGTRICRQLELELHAPAPDSAQVAVLARQLRDELLPPSSLATQ